MGHSLTITKCRHYVLLDTETEELKQDEFLTEEDAQDINEKLAADGSPYRWIPWEEQECA